MFVFSFIFCWLLLFLESKNQMQTEAKYYKIRNALHSCINRTLNDNNLTLAFAVPKFPCSILYFSMLQRYIKAKIAQFLCFRCFFSALFGRRRRKSHCIIGFWINSIWQSYQYSGYFQFFSLYFSHFVPSTLCECCCTCTGSGTVTSIAISSIFISLASFVTKRPAKKYLKMKIFTYRIIESKILYEIRKMDSKCICIDA